jgi:hypothetical protein
MKRLLTIATLLTAACVPSARAGDEILKFDGAVGVDPVGGFTSVITPDGTTAERVTINSVLGVPPGGRPWILRKFKASIKANGNVTAKGSGLLFSGGDQIGTRGGVTKVGLTLFCGGVAHSTAGVALDTQGNFSLKDEQFLTTPPNPCTSPVLLVRNANNGPLAGWFAAGLLSEDD